MHWLQHVLQTYPEIAAFLSLGIGYWVGGLSFKGFSLGTVTATLLAAILIGQWHIDISPNVKSVFFLMFLFAVGYGVGPQFVRGIAKDGLPQALFAVLSCVFCLLVPYTCAKIAGYDLGSSAGLYAGSQTISASMGLATDAINRLGRSPEESKRLLDAMPIAYAVTYIYGTIGSALVLAMLGPKLLRIDLVKACQDYEKSLGGGSSATGPVSAHVELRAYKVPAGSRFIGMSVGQAEHAEPGGVRLFVERIRRGGQLIDAKTDTVIEAGDVVALGGAREQLIKLLGDRVEEVEDVELLAVRAEGVDVYVSNKSVDGKSLEQLAREPEARGVFVRRIRRGATSVNIPVLPKTVLHRGDIVTLVGRTQDTSAAAKALGHADRATSAADVAFIGGAITIGGLVGALVLKIGAVPLTLSTAGGTLIAGIVFGWLRSIHPTFGRIPDSTVWFMNSVGLNMFIAVVGLTAGPGFVAGLKALGFSLFLWGIVATTLPLVLSMFMARYIFKFHPAILLGCCAGARTTTAALGMICDAAKSQVPGLGYTVTYAVGNTLLTIWGMVLIMMMS